MTPPVTVPAPGSVAQWLSADRVWTGESFASDLALRIDDAGHIAEIAPLSVIEGVPDTPPLRQLRGRALLPGFVNAHSHAFQRGLRGRGETFPAGTGSFWTWREAMYALVKGLDAETLATLCRRTFSEMLAAGITTVGEFHYVHHREGKTRDFEFDAVVLETARQVGLRIVLLETYYETGGIGQPLAGGQRRFATPEPDDYWQQIDHLAARLDPTTQSLGAVAHSIRAVPLERLRELHSEARRRDMVLHMHVEEQRQEIESCRLAHGTTPTGLLLDHLELDGSFTAVHCTHTDPADMERYLATGARVCLCPLTEANLGDGIADLPTILERGHGGQADGTRGDALCLGSDSNARISMLEEVRWLEYVQRLARERRGVCRDDGGRLGRRLLDIATVGGAHSLGLEAGRIAPGQLADLIAVDLGHPTLEGWDDETLLETILLGADNSVIAEVCVGGRWLR